MESVESRMTKAVAFLLEKATLAGLSATFFQADGQRDLVVTFQKGRPYETSWTQRRPQGQFPMYNLGVIDVPVKLKPEQVKFLESILVDALVAWYAWWKSQVLEAILRRSIPDPFLSHVFRSSSMDGRHGAGNAFTRRIQHPSAVLSIFLEPGVPDDLCISAHALVDDMALRYAFDRFPETLRNHIVLATSGDPGDVGRAMASVARAVCCLVGGRLRAGIAWGQDVTLVCLDSHASVRAFASGSTVDAAKALCTVTGCLACDSPEVLLATPDLDWEDGRIMTLVCPLSDEWTRIVTAIRAIAPERFATRAEAASFVLPFRAVLKGFLLEHARRSLDFLAVVGSDAEEIDRVLRGESSDLCEHHHFFLEDLSDHVSFSKRSIAHRLGFDVGPSRTMATLQIDLMTRRVLPAVARMGARVPRGLLRNLMAVKRFWECHV
jgi:hypothetical protein